MKDKDAIRFYNVHVDQIRFAIHKHYDMYYVNVDHGCYFFNCEPTEEDLKNILIKNAVRALV